MKKFITAAIASMLLVASMAPTFAAVDPVCARQDGTLCSESLSPTSGD